MSTDSSSRKKMGTCSELFQRGFLHANQTKVRVLLMQSPYLIVKKSYKNLQLNVVPARQSIFYSLLFVYHTATIDTQVREIHSWQPCLNLESGSRILISTCIFYRILIKYFRIISGILRWNSYTADHRHSSLNCHRQNPVVPRWGRKGIQRRIMHLV